MWTISAHYRTTRTESSSVTMLLPTKLKVGTYRYFKDIEAAHLDPESL
jgi:hypothetical protein